MTASGHIVIGRRHRRIGSPNHNSRRLGGWGTRPGAHCNAVMVGRRASNRAGRVPRRRHACRCGGWHRQAARRLHEWWLWSLRSRGGGLRLVDVEKHRQDGQTVWPSPSMTPPPSMAGCISSPAGGRRAGAAKRLVWQDPDLTAPSSCGIQGPILASSVRRHISLQITPYHAPIRFAQIT